MCPCSRHPLHAASSHSTCLSFLRLQIDGFSCFNFPISSFLSRMTVWNWNLSLRQRQIDQPEELRCASRAGDCPWNNNGFSFYSSSLVSFSPGSPSHNTGKKSNHSFPKNRFPNCGMWANYCYCNEDTQAIEACAIQDIQGTKGTQN